MLVKTTPSARKHPFLQGPHPRAFAHRGWHIEDLQGLENSLAAFRRAVNEGYRYLETDVHASADGVAVVHHDPDLDRTTDSGGNIHELPWSAVRAARIGGKEHVCALDDLLEELPDALLNIDVKADSAVIPTLRVIRRHDAWDRVCLASFDETRLDMLRKHGDRRLLTSMGPRSVAGLWFRSRTPVDGSRRQTRIRGFAAQIPETQGRLRILDSRLIRTAHRLGAEVHVWTVDDPARMRHLLELGVDGLLTDRPELLRDLLRRRGQWSC